MKNSIKWHHCENSEKCAAEIGKKISNLFANRNDKKILLLLSGGSSLAVPSHILSGSWKNITLAMIDERFDLSNLNNNFSQLKNTPFFSFVSKLGANFISTKTLKTDTPQLLAKRFSKSLESWLVENPKGEMVAIMGMGADGHIAGILPFPESEILFKKLFESDNIVVAYDASGKNNFAKRVTATNTFLKKIDHSFAYICGSEKKNALTQLNQGSKTKAQLPVMILAELKDCEVFSDINLYS